VIGHAPPFDFLTGEANDQNKPSREIQGMACANGAWHQVTWSRCQSVAATPFKAVRTCRVWEAFHTKVF